MPFDKILYEISYQNFLLYGAVIPSYHQDKDKGATDKVIDSRNPENSKLVKDFFSKLK